MRIRRSRFGMQRIAFELRQKGIDEKLVCEAMPELKDSELEVARGVWQKKFGVFPGDDREKARQIRFLQSRGFAQDVILKVLRVYEDDCQTVQQPRKWNQSATEGTCRRYPQAR